MNLANVVKTLRRSLFSSPHTTLNNIALTPSGYVVRKGNTVVDSLEWDDVARITAYKRDLLTEDQICLYFECFNEQHHEVNEDMIGFEELSELLPTAFPGLLPQWREAVVQPAFAPKATELWVRSK